jgi:hypothetical protein
LLLGISYRRIWCKRQGGQVHCISLLTRISTKFYLYFSEVSTNFASSLDISSDLNELQKKKKALRLIFLLAQNGRIGPHWSQGRGQQALVLPLHVLGSALCRQHSRYGEWRCWRCDGVVVHVMGSSDPARGDVERGSADG